jgi:hypothetical protein
MHNALNMSHGNQLAPTPVCKSKPTSLALLNLIKENIYKYRIKIKGLLQQYCTAWNYLLICFFFSLITVRI